MCSGSARSGSVLFLAQKKYTGYDDPCCSFMSIRSRTTRELLLRQRAEFSLDKIHSQYGTFASAGISMQPKDFRAARILPFDEVHVLKEPFSCSGQCFGFGETEVLLERNR